MSITSEINKRDKAASDRDSVADDHDYDLFSSPFYLIAHANFMFHDQLDVPIAGLGLDRTTYRMLTVLKQKKGINIKDLAAYSLLKRSTASRALIRLKKEGLVSHTLDENDSRSAKVELTEEGLDLARRMTKVGANRLQEATCGMKTMDLETLQELLKKIVANLSEHSSKYQIGVTLDDY